MRKRAVRRGQRGETLVEILITVVLIGVVFSALAIALATGSTTSNEHRNLVTADALLRDYAEAAKSAARADCATSSTYATTTTSLPAGFSVVAGPTNGMCAPDSASVQQVQFTVSIPGGTQRSLSIDVRNP